MGPTDDAGEDVDGFVAAYRRTLPAVLGYIGRATAGDRALAEDLTAETYLAALGAWRVGNSHAVEESWLVGVARHKLVDRWRREARDLRKRSLVPAGNGDDDNGDDALADDDVLAAIRELRPLQRAAFALRYVDEYTVAEVASRLGRSASATESLLRRARRELDANLRTSEPT
jgi:RNA polymerase sigma-70 factor (ECF subfamily)